MHVSMVVWIAALLVLLASSITLSTLFDDCCILDTWCLVHPSHLGLFGLNQMVLSRRVMILLVFLLLGLFLSPLALLFHAHFLTIVLRH